MQYPVIDLITNAYINNGWTGLDILENAIGIKADFSHRLKLPLPHYFPHPVIDALTRASAGTQTVEDIEILRRYLTPLGIGGI